jgi:hypothetical protein
MMARESHLADFQLDSHVNMMGSVRVLFVPKMVRRRRRRKFVSPLQRQERYSIDKN